ncbi:hypothetical protein KW89_312 [Piscirickettsia salmonis]|nr:hypothetical protein KW89_312 [Piscirickettsia salmonis]
MGQNTLILNIGLERVAGIEPASSAWKAEVLPFNYTRVVVGEGFEPSKAEPPDLQSGPFDRSGTPPFKVKHYSFSLSKVNDFT